jgi:hypothetical protein
MVHPLIPIAVSLAGKRIMQSCLTPATTLLLFAKAPVDEA